MPLVDAAPSGSSVNLATALLASARNRPDRPALAGPEPMTYAQLAARAAAVAAEVARRTRSGDRVAIVSGNDAAFVVAYLGTLRAGAVAVPLNVGSPSHELARELDAVEPDARARVGRARRPGAPSRARSSRDRRFPSCVVDDLRAGRSRQLEPVQKDAADLAVLLFTAGTAGAPSPRCSRTGRCSRTSSRCNRIRGCG